MKAERERKKEKGWII